MLHFNPALLCSETILDIKLRLLSEFQKGNNDLAKSNKLGKVAHEAYFLFELSKAYSFPFIHFKHK